MTTNVYTDIFDLLRDVKAYVLKEDETFIPLSSQYGTHLGFCTADGTQESVEWVIGLEDFRKSCSGSSNEVYAGMRFYHTRLPFLRDLLAGRVDLDTTYSPIHPVFQAPGDPKEVEVEEFLEMLES